MRHFAETRCQNFIFFVNGFVFIQDEHILTLNFAQTTFNPDAGYPQILFGYCNIQFFSKIFQLLIDLFGLHDNLSAVVFILCGKALTKSVTSFQLEK